ncbi:MAG: phytoene dehydrogenase-like protein [Candidatus Latescibacterota bacterium]|jgi:phytoene dehydrogenase-like protein
MKSPDVIIIGAGVAGLCCARHLHECGIECLLLESSDAVGGRVRTDLVDGFLLDRGFQVLLTAYPEARRVLDYEALDLKPFYPGALVRCASQFARMADPFRQPLAGILGLFNPVGTLADKLRMAGLRQRVRRGSHEDLLRQPEQTTLAALQAEGFSPQIIERFFRPFLGGIFLENGLETASGLFDFVFRMFSTGHAALPACGMGAISAQLAAGLPNDWVRTNSRVEAVVGHRLHLADGETLEAKAVVIAAEEPAAARLLGLDSSGSREVTCLYFAAEVPPVIDPILVLNGTGAGPINNLCVPSQVAPDYAPANEALVSVTVLGAASADTERAVRRQLVDWYGNQVEMWRLLQTYYIPHALPKQRPFLPLDQSARTGEQLYICGDHRASASLQGAMYSGRKVAELIGREWGLPVENA